MREKSNLTYVWEEVQEHYPNTIIEWTHQSMYKDHYWCARLCVLSSMITWLLSIQDREMHEDWPLPRVPTLPSYYEILFGRHILIQSLVQIEISTFRVTIEKQIGSCSIFHFFFSFPQFQKLPSQWACSNLWSLFLICNLLILINFLIFWVRGPKWLS